MEKIASFTVNHDRLEKGMYVSRTDGDVITYDIRMKKPNGGDYLGNRELHTFEHLFATYARNSEYGSQVIYVGPMGCRTGFYLLLRDAVSGPEAIRLVLSGISRERFPEAAGKNAVTTGSMTWREHGERRKTC